MSQSAMSRFHLVIALVLLWPSSVLAAVPSHDAILGAVAELQKNALGACTEKKETFGDDCIKTTITCRDVAGTLAGLAGAAAAGAAGGIVGGLPGAVVGGIVGATQAQQFAGIGNYWALRYELVAGQVRPKAGVQEPLALDWLRADWANNSKTVPPAIVKGTCYCECVGDETFEACKGKPKGTPFRVAEDMTKEQCLAKCQPRSLHLKCAGSLPPVSLVTAAAEAEAVAKITEDLTCFKPDECAAQKGIFEATTPPGLKACPSGKGRCYAPEPAVDLNVPIGPIKRIQGFAQYVFTAYRYLISIAAIAATVMFVYGAFLYLLGTAIPRISQGKSIMTDAVIGLLLILGANLILRTLNPATLTLNPIRVFMINTLQLVSVQYCSDLAGIKLAEAGVKPAIKPYEEVAKDPKAFSIAAQDTQCGKSYWVEKAIGSSCEGSKCPPGEGCISCADATAPGCVGIQGDRRVCSKAIFAGSINYIEERYPEKVYLIMVCNHAQAPKVEGVEGNLSDIITYGARRTGKRAGAEQTQADQAGVAGYSFNFNQADLQQAVSKCKDKGGFRGAVLGVQYNDDTFIDAATRVGVASALLGLPGLAIGLITLPADDFAVLSKSNCGSGIKKFDGYASGHKTVPDRQDLADGLFCGFRFGRFLDDPNKTNYWSEQELKDALGGKTILCDFSLSNNNAPTEPGRACLVTAAGAGGQQCVEGQACAVPGTQCSAKCKCNQQKKIECVP